MKNLFLIMLSLITLQISAQEFAPIGAKWHYTQLTENPEVIAFQTIESVSDTLIEGISCKKLIKASIYMPSNDSTIFLYSFNDSVFVYDEGTFRLLYDFGALTGDTIELGYLAYNGLPLKMIIDSTGTIDINGQLKKMQDVKCGDGVLVEFGGRIIEGIGNLEYMFPLLDNYIDGPLRCYEDDDLGLFRNPYHTNNGWDYVNCEQILTGIPEMDITESISIYPNPIISSFAITNLDRATDFELLDLHGRIVMTGIVNLNQEIKIESLPKGLYLLKLQNNKLTRIIKVQKQ